MKMPRISMSGHAVCAVMVCACLVPAATAAGSYTEKIFTTPDYLQTDSAYGGLPGGGSNYCGPVSVSNSVMWLADHGFAGLSPDTGDRKYDQFRVAEELGSLYMNSHNGTSAYELSNGLKNYIADSGFAYERLEYQGWRYVLPEFDTGIEVPEMDWIASGVEGLGSAWLNVGWYDYDSPTDTYTRFGGHWITLVGHGHDGQGEDPARLIAHDPAPRAGSGFSNEYVLPEEILSGTLTGATGLPRSAAGYYKMTGGMHVRSSADFGILDGVVVLTMPTPGDFDVDGDVDADDVDALCDNMGGGPGAHDLDGDGDTDEDDFVYLVEHLVEWSRPGAGGVGTKRGDANLDGYVNATDLATLAGHFGDSGPGWSGANFNCDDVVNATDLAILAADFGFQAPTSAVPEPATMGLLGLGGLVPILSGLKRRK